MSSTPYTSAHRCFAYVNVDVEGDIPIPASGCVVNILPLNSLLTRAGKTTLLNCLGRHIMPQGGTVRVKADGNQDSTAENPQTMIGYVVDSANFFDNVTVRVLKGKAF